LLTKKTAVLAVFYAFDCLATYALKKELVRLLNAFAFDFVVAPGVYQTLTPSGCFRSILLRRTSLRLASLA